MPFDVQNEFILTICYFYENSEDVKIAIKLLQMALKIMMIRCIFPEIRIYLFNIHLSDFVVVCMTKYCVSLSVEEMLRSLY